METTLGLTSEWADLFYYGGGGFAAIFGIATAIAAFGYMRLAAIAGLITAVAVGFSFWGSLARDEIAMRLSDPTTFDVALWPRRQGVSLEIRPRGGQLSPFMVLVPKEERPLLTGLISGPSGALPRTAITSDLGEHEQAGFSGKLIGDAINAQNSAYATFSSLPSRLLVGQPNGIVKELIPPPAP